jgi:hypothetical protein
VTTVGRSTVSPHDFAHVMEETARDLKAAETQVASIAKEALAKAPTSRAARRFLSAKEEGWGVETALKDLIDTVAPLRTRDLKLALQSQKSLSSAVRSFEALCKSLRALNAGPEKEEVTPRAGRAQFGTRTGVLEALHAVRGAFDAVSSKTKASFPLAQLERLELEVKKDAKKIESARDDALLGLNSKRALTADALPTIEVAASEIARLTGDASIGPTIVEAASRAEDRGAMKEHLALFAMILDQATSAPDYATTRVGWQSPRAREQYRDREFEPWDMYAAHPAHEPATETAIAIVAEMAGAKDPEAVLKAALPPMLIRELGVDPAIAKDWKMTTASLLQAMGHEVFLPLRAYNEVVDDIVDARGARAHEATIRDLILDITRHVLEGDYQEWRYAQPWSEKQLAPLSSEQKKRWMSGLTIESGALKTREEDGPELLWVTKIGGPSHGFDVGPNCLLPLLANGRSKAILVDDPRWPRHAAARCYLRVLSYENGKPLLYLEPMERDFPHRDAFEGENEDAQFRLAQIRHAVEKAKALGVPLSLSRYDDELLDHLGVKYDREEERLVVEPSGGVFEASDTLELGHDCVQTERLVTSRLERIVVRPASS